MNNGQSKKYFDEPIFEWIAQKLRKNYYHKKEFGSRVKLPNDVDLLPLYRFLGLGSVQSRSYQQLSIKQFEAALQQSKFALSLSGFVYLFDETLLLDKETEKQKYEEKFEEFLQQLRQFSFDFGAVLTKKQLQYWFEKEDLSVFRQVDIAFSQLPQDFTRLSFFAYQITGNPHAFDKSQPVGELFLQILSAKYLENIRQDSDFLAQAEIEQLLYQQVYLLKDDILNFVALHRISGYVNHQEVPVWWSIANSDMSWNASVRELLKVDELRPVNYSFVILVENSGVYSLLLERFPDLPLLCTSGQMKFAVWIALRKLTQQQKVQLYYAGDMDPEGLLMADKLSKAFCEQVSFLAMDKEAFEEGKENKIYETNRLKKMNQIKNEGLKHLIPLIQQNQVCYQEGCIDYLIQQIEQILS